MTDIVCVVALLGFIFCLILMGLAIASSYSDAQGRENRETNSLRDAIRRAEREQGRE